MSDVSSTQKLKNGDPGRTRTLNILIRSEVLYPVELPDRCSPSTETRPTDARDQAVQFCARAKNVNGPRQNPI